VIAASLLLAVTATFTPPRLLSGDPSGLPAAVVVGGGEVLVAATVSKDGTVSRAVLLRTTAPFGQMVLDAVSRWRFAPAHAPDRNNVEQSVEASVLIAAVYRAPAMFNAATLGTPPLDVSAPSSDTPYPMSMPPPAYPPGAAFGGVVMLEVSLDEAGITRDVRTVRSRPGFDAAARDIVRQWNFRGASWRSLPVPSTAYVIVGFTPPVATAPSGNIP
jgi:TonB family protein